jgi:Flp pilus assembly protein TadG
MNSLDRLEFHENSCGTLVIRFEIGVRMVMNICKSVASLFRRLNADRRGATAIVFAAGAVGLFGFVGLATEGGTWYLERRHGQNAADTAATAGALALYNKQDAPTSGLEAAKLSGYSSGVTVETGTFSGGLFTASAASSANAVHAVVTTTSPRLFSNLFGSGNVIISESAVAMMADIGPVCMLAGAGGFSVQDNGARITASGCIMASNATGGTAIQGASPPVVSNAQLLVSSGGCSGCTGLTTPPLTYQPPTPNPPGLTAIEQLPLPNKTCSTDASTWVPYNESATPPKINCASTYTVKNTPVNLTPGTYIFYNASISMDANGILECTTCQNGAGVTIIMTGDPGSIGTFSIANGNPTINLMAPATSDFDPAFNGVLLYQDSRAAQNNLVELTGNSSSVFGGAMYLPSADVKFTGNGGASMPTCAELVGYALNFAGSAGVTVSGCGAQNITYAQTVRLAQ